MATELACKKIKDEMELLKLFILAERYRDSREIHIETKQRLSQLHNEAANLLNKCHDQRKELRKQHLRMKMAYNSTLGCTTVRRGTNRLSKQSRRNWLRARLSSIKDDAWLMATIINLPLRAPSQRARVNIPVFRFKIDAWKLFKKYGEAITRIWEVKLLLRERVKTTRELLHRAKQALENSDGTIRQAYVAMERVKLDAITEGENSRLDRQKGQMGPLEQLQAELKVQESNLLMVELFGVDVCDDERG
ncbi:hypothetical protein B0H11DRAFT_2093501 [Mycena galericulata]|nr:hypothetical protein B0H11DRAFT_2093501 [Mycena galericulata]